MSFFQTFIHSIRKPFLRLQAADRQQACSLLPAFFVLLCTVLITILGFHASGQENPISTLSQTSYCGTLLWESDDKKEGEEKDFIKWVDFHADCSSLKLAYQYDVDSYEDEIHFHWIDLLAYAACKNGNDFSKTSVTKKAMEDFTAALKEGTSCEELTRDMKYFPYYKECFTAILGGMVGEFETEADDGTMHRQYGLKAFLPIAKNFPYSDYDDFGASRSYGYARPHLGHDMMGQVGTPVVAAESGYIEAMGWNKYGGWRIGIRSFDKKRYYYYAHLRKDFPFCKTLKEGDAVTAGDVIGYMGRTGYSTTENVNNIDEYHLHFGLQIIFDESQKEGNNEIWIDCYELTKFLYQNRSETQKNEATKEWVRIHAWKDPAVDAFIKSQEKTK